MSVIRLNKYNSIRYRQEKKERKEDKRRGMEEKRKGKGREVKGKEKENFIHSLHTVFLTNLETHFSLAV
jgi:hypothetical protein